MVTFDHPILQLDHNNVSERKNVRTFDSQGRPHKTNELDLTMN